MPPAGALFMVLLALITLFLSARRENLTYIFLRLEPGLIGPKRCVMFMSLSSMSTLRWSWRRVFTTAYVSSLSVGGCKAVPERMTLSFLSY